MKKKIYTKIHYDKDIVILHKKAIQEKGGKSTIRKLYDESLGKHYYEISYYF